MAVTIEEQLLGTVVAGIANTLIAIGGGAVGFHSLSISRIVLGGLLFFLGMHFLVEWTYDAWFRLTRSVYAIVIMILGFVAVPSIFDT